MHPQRVGVAFDHTPLDPIVLADHDGVPRTFEIRSMLVATGHAMRAEEVPRRERGSYRFAVLGDRNTNVARTCCVPL